MDSGGLPICFDLPEGERHDIVHAESLVEQLEEVNTIVCDKGYDSEPFRIFVKGWALLLKSMELNLEATI